MLKTERLILRRWEESDAESLYHYAKRSGCRPYRRTAAASKCEREPGCDSECIYGREAYAVCLKTDNKAIGVIELKLNGHTDMTERDDECELGYWLGKLF